MTSYERSTVRISVTIPRNLHERLITQSMKEGRSLANLAAYLLESSMESRAAELRRLGVRRG